MVEGTPESAGHHAQTAQVAPGEEALEAYRHEKLQLADVLLGLMHIAEARRDDERIEQVREISAQMAEDRFQLAVVGQFSRGKSTLMNAVLGYDYLPTGALPMTSVITTVVYGSRPKATVWRGEGSMPIETPLGDLVRYVAQASQERQELGVRSALIELPAEVLRLGFSFVDTPGVGSAIVANTKTTERFLLQADAVIFVTSFDSPFSEAEMAFLRLVRNEVKRLFFVLNKRDLVSDVEAVEIEAFVIARLKELGIVDPDVFALSARDGLAAKLRGDLPGLLDSGLEPLEAELTDYLTAEKAREFLLRVGERAEKVAASFASEARAAVGLSRDGLPGPLLSEFVEDLLERLDSERCRLVSALMGSVLPQVEQFPKEMAPKLVKGLLEVVGPEADLTGRRGQGEDLRAPLAVTESWIRQSVKEWGDKAVDAWLANLEKTSEELLSGLSGIPGELMRETSRRFGTVAAPVDDGVSRRLPRVIAVRVDLTMSVRRAKLGVRPRKKSAALLREVVQATAEDHAQQLASAVRRSVDQWLAEIGTWSQRELLRAVDRVKARLATPPSDNLDGELSALTSAIAASRSRLESWSIARGREMPNPSLRPSSRRVAARESGCVVCEQLVKALFQFMSHYQFQLATLVGARRSHAVAKGFCAAHTWYYEYIGSPVGVSQGYAPLAEATADTLLEAVAGTSGRAELEAALSRASRADCAACARLYSVCKEVLRRLSANLERSGSPQEIPALCLRHAAEMISLGLDDDSARQVVSSTASRLKRRAEDMRSYSLKRQSLRRGFIDEEEETAYRDVLLRLVGHPLLAGAPRDRGSA
jgi:small GTP-binding protein